MYSRRLIVELFDKYLELNDDQKMLAYLDERFKGYKKFVSRHPQAKSFIYVLDDYRINVENITDTRFTLNISCSVNSTGLPWFRKEFFKPGQEIICTGLKSGSYNGIYYEVNPKFEKVYKFMDNTVDVSIYWDTLESLICAFRCAAFDEIISVKSVD